MIWNAKNQELCGIYSKFMTVNISVWISNLPPERLSAGICMQNCWNFFWQVNGPHLLAKRGIICVSYGIPMIGPLKIIGLATFKLQIPSYYLLIKLQRLLVILNNHLTLFYIANFCAVPKYPRLFSFDKNFYLLFFHPSFDILILKVGPNLELKVSKAVCFDPRHGS